MNNELHASPIIWTYQLKVSLSDLLLTNGWGCKCFCHIYRAIVRFPLQSSPCRVSYRESTALCSNTQQYGTQVIEKRTFFNETIPVAAAMQTCCGAWPTSCQWSKAKTYPPTKHMHVRGRHTFPTWILKDSSPWIWCAQKALKRPKRSFWKHL